MTAVIKFNTRTIAAKAVLQQIESNQTRFSYFLGKTDSFVDSFTGAPITIEDPVNTREYEGKTRSSIIAARSVGINDISLVIPRYNWNAGSIFDQYDPSAADTDTAFYCLVEDTFNVYKCIVSPGTPSTVAPSGTDASIINLPDGYSWKFMYNIPLSLRNKFMTSSWIPVTTSLGIRNYNQGSIETLRISDAGSSLNDQNITAVVIGDGTGALITPIISGGKLVDFQIANSGTGYTYAAVVFTGTGTLPTVDVIIKYGDAFTSQAIVERFAVPGTIDSATVIIPGNNIMSLNTVEGDGYGATVEPVLGSNGEIISVTVTNPGSGYTHASVSFFGSTGSNASVRLNISPVNGHGSDAVTELGAHALMFFTTLGANFIDGVPINTSYRQFGLIGGIRDYSTYNSQYAEVISTGYVAVSGIFSPGIVSPGDSVSWTGGTGTCIQKTVGTSVVGIIIKVTSGIITVGTTITCPGGNFSVISTEDRSTFQGSFGNACFSVTGTFNTGDYVPGTSIIVNNQGDKFRLISMSSTKMILHPLNTGAAIVIGEGISLIGTGTNFIVTAATTPTIDTNSGDILFIDNRLPFNQTSDQIVTFRSVIKF